MGQKQLSLLPCEFVFIGLVNIVLSQINVSNWKSSYEWLIKDVSRRGYTLVIAALSCVSCIDDVVAIKSMKAILYLQRASMSIYVIYVRLLWEPQLHIVCLLCYFLVALIALSCFFATFIIWALPHLAHWAITATKFAKQVPSSFSNPSLAGDHPPFAVRSPVEHIVSD